MGKRQIDREDASRARDINDANDAPANVDRAARDGEAQAESYAIDVAPLIGLEELFKLSGRQAAALVRDLDVHAGTREQDLERDGAVLWRELDREVYARAGEPCTRCERPSAAPSSADVRRCGASVVSADRRHGNECLSRSSPRPELTGVRIPLLSVQRGGKPS